RDFHVTGVQTCALPILRGLSLIYLTFTDFSVYELALFAAFYGLDWVATVPPTVKLAAERFGPEKAGIVFGWIFTGHQVGAAAAADRKERRVGKECRSQE